MRSVIGSMDFQIQGPQIKTRSCLCTVELTQQLSADDIQVLKRLLPTSSATSATSEPAGFLSTLTSPDFSSKTAYSYASLIHNSDPWIIDSGASKHMTENSKFFTSYSPQSGRDKVKIANGSLSLILGKGFIVNLCGLNLSDVLHVPDFPHSLLS